MLITTPLRNPRDGCVPMPITSMPVGVISPTMQQILVVPMSRPTTISPFFCDMGWLPLVREGCGGLVGTRRIVEIDPRGHLATPGQRRAHLREPAQFQRQLARAESDLLKAVALMREERIALVIIETHFGEGAHRLAGAAPGVEQVQRAEQPQLQ